MSKREMPLRYFVERDALDDFEEENYSVINRFKRRSENSDYTPQPKSKKQHLSKRQLEEFKKLGIDDPTIKGNLKNGEYS
jgi:Tfp pilus assembly protein PilP